MADSVSKIGFDVGQALTALEQLKKKTLSVGQALSKMAADAKKASASGLDQSMNKAATSAKKAEGALKKTEKQAKATGNALAKAGKQGAKAGNSILLSWQTIGRIAITQVLIRGVSTLIQTFSQAAESAKKFGLALSEIQTISRGTAGSSAALAVSIQKVGNEVGKTSQEVAEGVYQLLSNQVTDAANAMGVFEVATKLARVTASSTADAVGALSSVMNSYGMTADQASDVSDTLFTAVELGRLRLSELANTIGRVTPLTSALGISFKETAAAIAVMTRTGVRADTAITQLRAVTQKLVKPTEKMAELFRRWGVKDGKAAIAAFGGITGVLKKLAAETNNNSTEMASYFNRVRAIIGQMGIMTQRGRLMVETLEAMKNATGAAERAWAEFQGSEAFTLERKQAELANTLTASGSAWIAFWTGLNQAGIWTVQLWTGLTSDLQASTRAFADGLAANAKKASEAGIEAMKNFKVKTEEELDDILQAERKMLAEFNAEWNKAMDSSAESTKRLSASVKAGLLSTLGEIDKQIKPLKDFAKDFDDGQKNLKQQITDAEGGQEDAKFQKSQKGRTRIQQSQALNLKAIKETAKGLALYSSRVDEVGVKAGEEAFKRAESWNEEEKAIAKALKNKFLIRQADENSIKIEGDKLKALKAQYALREKLIKPVEAGLDLLQADKAKHKSLVDAIAKDFVRLKEATSLEDSEQVWSDINKNLAEASKIGVRDIGEDVRKAMGLEKLPKEVNDRLTERQYEIVLNANESIKKIQAKLEKINKEQAAKFDPTGEKEAQAGFVLDRGREQGESTAEFYGEALDEAKRITLEQSGAAKDLAGQQASLTVQQDQLIENQGRLNKFMNQSVPITAAVSAGIGKLSEVFGITKDGARELAQEQLNQQVNTSQTGAPYLKALQDAQSTLTANVPLEKKQLENLQKTRGAWLNSASATHDARVQLEGVYASITSVNATMAKIDANKKIVNTDELADAQKLLAQAEQRTKDANAAMDNLVKSSAGLAQNTKDFATAANDALGSTGGLEQSWQGVTTSVQNAGKAAVATWKAVAAAMKLAGASPSGGAPSANFFGGTRYLAAGGPVGQDTVAARLSPDEYVSSGATTRKFFSELNAMNNGVRPVYREQGGSVTNVGDVNVTVQGGDTAPQTVRELGRGLKRELNRKLL